MTIVRVPVNIGNQNVDFTKCTYMALNMISYCIEDAYRKPSVHSTGREGGSK